MARTTRIGLNRESENGYIHKTDQWVKMADGTVTAYDIWLPNPRKFPGKRPAIVRTHGNGRDGTWAGNEAEAINWTETFGFIVIYPDFRGQGRWNNVYRQGGNAGLWSVEQLCDVNDFIKLAKQLPECNGTVGTVGNSQGGLSSTVAAAWSGQAFPEYAYANGWYGRGENFQDVACAISINWPANPTEAVAPGGNCVGSKFDEAIFSPEPNGFKESLRGTAQGTRWAREVGKMQSLSRAGNAAGIVSLLGGGAATNQGGVIATLEAKMAASTVPVLYRWALDDVWRHWQTSWDWVCAQGTNSVVLISPGGHQSAYSTTETAWQSAAYNAFLEYHLLGTSNNSNLNVFGGTDWSDKHEIRMAIWPTTAADRNSNSYTYDYVWVNDKTEFENFTTTTQYARSNATLSNTPDPSASNTTDITQNWNDTDFDDDDWCDLVRDWQAGNSNDPVSILLGGGTPKLVPGTILIRRAALGGDRYICGTATATIFVEADKPEFMVAVSLFSYDPVSTDQTFLGYGWKKVTGYTSGVEEVTVQVGPCSAMVDGTHQIDMVVSTYPVDEFFRNGDDYYLHTRPIFGTAGEVTLTIHHNTNNQSRIALPLFATSVEVLDA